MTEHSNAMDLEQDIFKSGDPDKIAHSLKLSAEIVTGEIDTVPQRNVNAHFYENRAGKNLESKEREILENAKDKLRE